MTQERSDSILAKVSNIPIVSTKIYDIFFITAAIACLFLYDWRIFAWPAISPVVNALKLGLPSVMLLVILHLNPKLPKLTTLTNYYILLIAFMALGLASSVTSDYPVQSTLVWLKFAMRVIFALSLGLYMFNRPKIALTLCKIFIIISVLVVIQFILLVMTVGTGPISHAFTLSGIPEAYVGPFGLFGDAVPCHWIGVKRIPRLTGFWYEPSNASGFLFATFFLSSVVAFKTKLVRWRIGGIIALLGGIACAANAGFLGLGGALIAPYFLKRPVTKSKTSFWIIPILGIFLLVYAVFGRTLIAEYAFDVPFFHGITGLRHTRALTLSDPTDGRIELYKKALTTTLQQPFGMGFRVAGKTSDGSGFEDASATALVLWTTYTGFLGGILMVLIVLQVVLAARKRPLTLYQSQTFKAWVVATLQQSVYGTWMTPFYFILTLLFFTAIVSNHRAINQPNAIKRNGATKTRSND